MLFFLSKCVGEIGGNPVGVSQEQVQYDDVDGTRRQVGMEGYKEMLCDRVTWLSMPRRSICKKGTPNWLDDDQARDVFRELL